MELRIAGRGAGFLRLEFEAEPGERMQQTGRSWLVGLPPTGEVSMEVIEAIGREVERGAAEIAEEREERFAGPVALGEEGFIRDQRVVELVFAPKEQEDGALEVFDRVVVELHFDARPAVEMGRRDPWGERLLRHSLVNYAQARQWRKPHAFRSAKPSLQDAQMLRAVVREEGLYRITGADLEEAGVALQEIEPERIRMYYGGGEPLSRTFGIPPVERREIGIVVEDGGDGRFDREDFLLFYGEPASRWQYDEREEKYTYLHNLYTDDNVYWIGLGGETRGGLATRDGSLSAVEPQRPSRYRVRVHEESEQYIQTQTYTIKSGYEWYWEDFRGNARNYPTLIRDAVDEPVDIVLLFLGQSDATPTFTVKWNDEEVAQITTPSVRRASHTLRTTTGAREGLNQLGLVHTNSDPSRLDWYELEFSRRFVAEKGELFFDAPLKRGIAEFALSGFEEERPRIFEVSQGTVEIVDFDYDAAAGKVTFQDEMSEVPRRYAVAGSARWKRPVRLEMDRVSRLRQTTIGADYLVITHGDFAAAAERLADWRAQDDRFGGALTTQVIDIQDIYDEFSGGMLDPTALRNFMQYAFNQWTPAPFFVLLMGDGTYDYKNNSGTSTGNWIPAFQDGDSTYDEWYVRVTGNDILPDMAIGRIPVQTAAEAEGVVDKLIGYDQNPEVGPWQSRILLVADDLDNPEHPDNVEAMFLLDSEHMARNLLPPDLDLHKLYIAQYPLEGRTKPKAREEFIRRFNEGVLILTYLGHGNPDVLAHEQMFVMSRDLGEIDNGRRLPFFYTAASQVGVFDDPVRQSMPEVLLKKVDGGVIGMISATRVGFHESNVVLSEAFHEQMYRSGRKQVPVGMALMEAKQIVQVFTSGVAQRNIQRYSLFGDPAMHLAMPRYKVELTVPDSLSALEEVRIEGGILDDEGEPVGDFSGQVRVQAFDSSVMSRLDGLEYEQIGVALFRGFIPVKGGRFTARFRVPKDITYGGENGRISAYAWGDGYPAAFGAKAGLVLSGTAEEVVDDGSGPQIRIRFDGRAGFTDGDRVAPGAVLQAVISDPGGINITGETGHEIELSIDEESYKLTESFSVHGGDYREGMLEFALPMLEPGEHEIRLKAWDSFNNSAREEIVVEVSDKGESALKNLLFFPNPLREEEGYFTFDLASPARTVRIQIFSVSGRLVDEIDGEARSGYNQVLWTPAKDLANGTYLCRVQVEREDESKLTRTGIVQLLR